MTITESLLVAGTMVSLIASSTGIIIDILRQRRESRAAIITEKLELDQSHLDKDRLNMVEMTQAAVQNVGSWTDIDVKVREGFRNEITSMMARYDKLFQEFEEYRAKCNLSKQGISDVFEQIEITTVEKLDNGAKKELITLLNRARREIDI